jgi:hypothetical protein
VILEQYDSWPAPKCRSSSDGPRLRDAADPWLRADPLDPGFGTFTAFNRPVRVAAAAHCIAHEAHSALRELGGVFCVAILASAFTR